MSAAVQMREFDLQSFSLSTKMEIDELTKQQVERPIFGCNSKRSLKYVKHGLRRQRVKKRTNVTMWIKRFDERRGGYKDNAARPGRLSTSCDFEEH